MAGKKRKAEPVEEESSEDDSEFDEEGSDEGAPGGILEEEEDDDELEAEMAALEAIQREKRGGAGVMDKVRVNNKPGLIASLEDFGWTKKAKWIDHMVVVGDEEMCAPIPDINDDLQRETTFFERALASAEVAISRLKNLGVSVRRPDDFYAEMVKSDEHMKRVRAELIFEQTSQETREERRKAREQKRYGKQVQAEKLKERTLQKKDSIKSLDKWRKQRKRDGFEDNGSAPEGFEDEKRKKQGGGGGQHGRSTPETRDKKSFKDEKFGFGGRKRLKKQNDKESARDMTGYKPANFDKGFREGKGWGDLGSPFGGRGRDGGRGGRGGRGGGGRGGR